MVPLDRQLLPRLCDPLPSSLLPHGLRSVLHEQSKRPQGRALAKGARSAGCEGAYGPAKAARRFERAGEASRGGRREAEGGQRRKGGGDGFRRTKERAGNGEKAAESGDEEEFWGRNGEEGAEEKGCRKEQVCDWQLQ